MNGLAITARSHCFICSCADSQVCSVDTGSHTSWGSPVHPWEHTCRSHTPQGDNNGTPDTRSAALVSRTAWNPHSKYKNKKQTKKTKKKHIDWKSCQNILWPHKPHIIISSYGGLLAIWSGLGLQWRIQDLGSGKRIAIQDHVNSSWAYLITGRELHAQPNARMCCISAKVHPLIQSYYNAPPTSMPPLYS